VLNPHLKNYFFKYKGLLSAGVIAALVSTVLNLAPTYFVKNIIDALGEKNLQTYDLIFNLSGWLITIVLSSVMLFYQRMWVISASRHVEHDLRMDFFGLLQQQPKSFYDKHSSADIISAFTNDMERIRELMGPSILHGVRGVFLILSTLAYMYWLSPILTIYIIIPILLVPIVTPIVLAYMEKLYAKVQQALSNLTQITQETFTGISIIKDYAVEENYIRKFLKESQAIKKISLKATYVTGLEWPFLDFVAGISLVVLLFVGGSKVINSEITMGELIALMMLIFRIRMPLIIMGWVISMVQRGRSAMKRFYIIFDEMKASKVFVKEESTNSPIDISEIELTNLNFGFENNKEVLQNINMKLTKGQTIGIVGPVGSGKTTLVLLLAGIYQKYEGQIKINGKDAKEIPFSDRIKLFGWVPQDNFLFSTSIKENILLGQKANEGNYEKSGEVAGLKPDIAGFAQGYDSLLGERGINLSGGQKQRVSIARGLMANAPVLIFDDSFSSLDAQTENILLDNLSKIRKDKINVIISHRLSTLQNSDIIFVLQDGKIIEQGKHSELLAKKGYYEMTFEEQKTALEIEA
jgi:ATP-binding cassette subfamily B protein